MNKKIEQKGVNQIKQGVNSTLTVILFIFLLLGFVFLYRPLVNQVDELSLDLANVEADLLEKNILLADLQDKEADYLKYSDVSLKTLENVLPKGVSQDEIIDDINELAKKHDLTLNSLSFAKGGEILPGIEILKFNTSFEGDFRDLLNFLEALEQNSRRITVNSISVQVSDSEVAGITRANFSLALDTYYLPN